MLLNMSLHILELEIIILLSNFYIIVENETRCYSELGCLNITRSWYHIIYRPFNVFPLRREMINTKFILYTRENPTEGRKIKAEKESIENSFFDGTKDTKLIIHGFIDTSLSNWVSTAFKIYFVNLWVNSLWVCGALHPAPFPW